MSQKSTSEYLHGVEPEEQARLSLLNGLLNERSLRELNLRGGEQILDVGSGLGQFTRAMARAAGTRVVGVERSAEQITTAQQQAALAGDTRMVDFRQGDALQLPLRPNEESNFDVAHARFLLEHLRDPLSAVRSMVRAVKPGGRIVLEDDDHDMMRLWPEPPGFSAVWHAYKRSYEHLGNDPVIGRRLVSLLAEAGAIPVRNAFVYFGSCSGDRYFQAYVSNLVGVIDGARRLIIDAGLLDQECFDRAIQALRTWSQSKPAALWYAVSWAEGRRRE